MYVISDHFLSRRAIQREQIEAGKKIQRINLSRPSTRSSPMLGVAPVPASSPTPAALHILLTERGSIGPVPPNTVRADIPCTVRNALGPPPVCDLDRIVTADGRSCSESDRMELAIHFFNLIARLKPAPGSTTWVQVLRDAEAVEYSPRTSALSLSGRRNQKLWPGTPQHRPRGYLVHGAERTGPTTRMRPRSHRHGRWPQLLRERPDGTRDPFRRPHRPPEACPGLYYLGASAAGCIGGRVLAPYFSSIAFGKTEPKAVITEYMVSTALHHGLLLAGADCVLLYGTGDRASEIAAGTYKTGAAATDTAQAVPTALSAPTSTPFASGGVTETAAGTSSAHGDSASSEK